MSIRQPICQVIWASQSDIKAVSRHARHSPLTPPQPTPTPTHPRFALFACLPACCLAALLGHLPAAIHVPHSAVIQLSEPNKAIPSGS